jgi:tRNA U34 2-thiouridine synthase MnmA/TrmU
VIHTHILNSYATHIDPKKNTIYINKTKKNKILTSYLLKNNIISISLNNNDIKCVLNFSNNSPKYKKINHYNENNKYTFK